MARRRTVAHSRLFRNALLPAGSAAALVLAAATGCATYQNYPPIETPQGDAAINDLNVPPAPELMGLALRAVVQRYPFEGEFVVNLPPGMTEHQARNVVASIGDADARLASPALKPLADQGQVLHVTQVWLRAEKGTVEIMRPNAGYVPWATGKEHNSQVFRVRLASRWGKWKVEGIRLFVYDGMTPPVLNVWEEAPAP